MTSNTVFTAVAATAARQGYRQWRPSSVSADRTVGMGRAGSPAVVMVWSRRALSSTRRAGSPARRRSAPRRGKPRPARTGWAGRRRRVEGDGTQQTAVDELRGQPTGVEPAARAQHPRRLSHHVPPGFGVVQHVVAEDGVVGLRRSGQSGRVALTHVHPPAQVTYRRPARLHAAGVAVNALRRGRHRMRRGLTVGRCPAARCRVRAPCRRAPRHQGDAGWPPPGAAPTP